MRLRFWDKVILLAGAAAVLLVGTAVFIGCLRGDEDMSAAHRTLGIVFGAASALFGGYLIFLTRRGAMQRREYVVQRTDTGELRIAVKAIQNLVEKCVDLHEEIQLISMIITNTREGVVVELFISLANNISIPLAVASLQKQIKQYLVASSGIEVKEVRVSVESTQDDPEMFEAQEDEAPGTEIITEKEARGKKVPLHQRLFGKPDQPAIVPEPPKEEEDSWRKPLEPATEEEPISPAESGEKTPSQTEGEIPDGEESIQSDEVADDTAEDTSKAESNISEAEEVKPETEE